MPYKPKKPCSYPGCAKLTNGTYCDEHKALMDKQYNKYERDPKVKHKYGCNWKRVRDAYIKSHPLCEDCLEKGYTVPATEVHHVIPVKQGGSNDWSNLAALCQSCHQKRHIALGDRKNRYQ